MQMTTHRTYLQSQIAATIGRTASRLNVIAFLVSLKEEDKFEGEQVDEAMEAMSYIGLLDDATKMVAVAPLPITHHLLFLILFYRPAFVLFHHDHSYGQPVCVAGAKDALL